MFNINLLGHYIWRRIQKDNSNHEFRMKRPQEWITGLFVGSSDIQRYIDDYFNYGIDHMGGPDFEIDDECADDRIERYWDDADGKEE